MKLWSRRYPPGQARSSQSIVTCSVAVGFVSIFPSSKLTEHLCLTCVGGQPQSTLQFLTISAHEQIVLQLLRQHRWNLQSSHIHRDSVINNVVILTVVSFLALCSLTHCSLLRMATLDGTSWRANCRFCQEYSWPVWVRLAMAY